MGCLTNATAGANLIPLYYILYGEHVPDMCDLHGLHYLHKLDHVAA